MILKLTETSTDLWRITVGEPPNVRYAGLISGTSTIETEGFQGGRRVFNNARIVVWNDTAEIQPQNKEEHVITQKKEICVIKVKDDGEVVITKMGAEGKEVEVAGLENARLAIVKEMKKMLGGG